MSLKIQRTLVTATIASILSLGSMAQVQAATIAVVDSGLNPGRIGGRVAPGGFDFFNNDGNPADDDFNQHGTAVAATLLSVSPSNTIIPIKAFGNNRNTNTAALNASFNSAAASSANIVNHSNASIANTSLAALQAVTGSGKVLVMQSGNNGLANPVGDAQKTPSLGGRAIVVGGTSGSGRNIASFSNRAGNLQDFYVLADPNSVITSSVGTSMATARVSGIAAAIINASPGLSPEQVVSIILESAIDLGPAGTDATFGRGVASLSNAMTALGSGNIPSAGGGGGSDGTGIALGALVLGGGVAYLVLNRDKELKKTIFVDKYGRAFNFDLKGRISVNGSAPKLSELIPNSNLQHANATVNGQQLQLMALHLNNAENTQVGFSDDSDANDFVAFTLRNADYADNQTYAMALNQSLNHDFGALSFAQSGQRAGTVPNINFAASEILTTPMLGYSSEGTTLEYGWQKDNGNEQKLALALVDEQQEHGLRSNSVLYEASKTTDNSRLGFQFGTLVENGSLFGGASGGAFSVSRTNTYFMGVNAAHQVSRDTTVYGSYFQGVSDVKASNNGLLNDFTSIRSEGFGIGMVVDNLFSPRLSSGLAVSVPMQAKAGNATLTIPVGQSTIGNVNFESNNLSFADNRRETILESFVDYQLNAGYSLYGRFSYTDSPVNNPDLSRDRVMLVGWQKKF